MFRFVPSLLGILLLGSYCLAQSQPVANPPSASSSTTGTSVDDAPVTVRPEPNARKAADNDPVFGVPALPQSKTSLVGGKLTHIDGVHNRLAVKVFGGGKWNIAFDERTHFFRDGVETTFENIKKGDRIYVDTMLDGQRIFARNVRVITKTGPADARGQVLSTENGYITVQDELSDRPVQFSLASDTQVKRNGSSVSTNEIQPGSIIAIQFSPAGQERGGEAREVEILAAPGQQVTFAGKVMHLDLRNNHIAVENQTDNKTYEIALDEKRQIPSNLMVGSEVTVAAVYDGKQYKADNISVK
jgi:hypothetical protein